MHVRIVRHAESMTELRDALAARRVARERTIADWERQRAAEHYASQLRTYGQVEVPLALSH